MKKNIQNLVGSLLFIGLALLISVPIAYLLRPTASGNFRKPFVGFYAEEENGLDMVLFGSSAAYRFISTPYLWEKFGITSYNLTTGSQPTGVLEALIEEVQKSQNPQLYIVEVRRFLKDPAEKENTEVYLRRVTDNMNYSWNRTKLVLEESAGQEDRISYLFDLLKYHGEWEKIFRKSRLAYGDNKEAQPMKGWENIFEVKKIKKPKISGEVEMQELHEQAQEDLLDLINYCDEHKIDVLFLATPWKMSKEDAGRSRYLEKIVTSHGYTYLDCNLYYDEIGLDFSADFYDKKHVNVWGAEKVTQFVGDYITANYQVTGEHDEKTRQKWDAFAQMNREEIEEQICSQ